MALAVPPADDATLETLLLPFTNGPLAWPSDGRALFLRARVGWPLRQLPASALVCEQSFKPFADALERGGRKVVAAADGRFPVVLLLPPRQREEARTLFARALDHLESGGVLVACQANSEGAKSGEADLAKLAGLAGNLSKNKCRVYWTRGETVEATLHAQWRELDAPRRIADGRFLGRPGLFAWDRIDAASALLASQLPDDLAGRAADFGAGTGYLASELIARCPGVTAVDLYEAEARALDLARENLQSEAARIELGFHWHDVTVGVPGRYDVIVSNPPFHQGRADQPALGRAFIATAAAALRDGGRLWLVANRHLPYEEALVARFKTVRTVATADGFKVFEAIK